MNPIVSAFIAVFLVSALSGIGVLSLLFRDAILRPLVSFLVALSVGALFGDAFIHLIPEAFETAPSTLAASMALSMGVFTFFILEKFLRWRHSHGIHEESVDTLTSHTHEKTHLGWLVFFGDGVHNFIDGIIIGASFLISYELGVATTLAIMLHEIPQEMGDFGLLLHAGFSRAKALAFNFASALFAIAGTAVALILGRGDDAFLALAGAFAAGGFIYIAGSDLVPELHGQKSSIKGALVQTVSVGIGFALMFALVAFE